ncbi:MAG: BACON domain-containing carbohydrate-binding protein, partial [Proteiniphilum sp.]
MNTIWITLALMLAACGGNDSPLPVPPKPDIVVKWEISPATMLLSATGETKNIIVTANGDWTATSGQSWCSLTPDKGGNGETLVKITATANPNEEARNAEIIFTSGKYSQKYTVTQAGATIENHVPEGYSLVWQDEFNEERLSGGKPALPNNEKWWYENLPKGAVNNELQTYVGGFRDADTVAAIHDGTLKIIAQKSGADIISARINT